MNISIGLISEAIEYYKGCGFEMIEVPLVVDQDVSNLTKPKGIPDLSHIDGKVYVASAEQSFVQLHKEGNLLEGKYMALTPCYRPERLLDDIHYLMFLKLELIIVGCDQMEDMIDYAGSFFSKYIPVTEDPLICDDFEIKYDLMYKDIELGSYGCRKMLDGTIYTYGTGMASPRLEYCINKYRRFYDPKN